MKALRFIALGMLAGVILTGTPPLPARAASPMNRLDNNAGDPVLAAAVSTLLSTALLTVGIPAPVVVSGRVLAHPTIHNLYWDDNWDGHNSAAPTMASIDGFSGSLAASHYFDAAGQYGVGSASFSGSNQSSVLCGPRRPGSTTDFFQILLWATCEAGLPGDLPPLFPPFPNLVQGLPGLTGVPSPDDNTLYVIYLPPNVNVSDFGLSTCGNFGAYHFMSALPETQPLPFPHPIIQSFAFAVIPTICDDASGVEHLATHEILEASTDPIFGLGWIDNSTFHVNNLITFATMGEAADICALVVPTPPVTLNNGVSVVPYWSNKDGACVPAVPSTSMTVGSPSALVGATTFVTSATDVTVLGSIGAGGAGDSLVIHSRFFRQGTAAPSFTTCATNPCVLHLNTNDGLDGAYTVAAFTEDKTEGISSPTSTKTLVLDNTPPISTLTIGMPRYPLVAPKPFITSGTPLALNAVDAGSGVASVSYRIFPQGTVPPSVTTVAGSNTNLFVVGVDGDYEVDTFATDRLGNIESTHVQLVHLDNTAPVIVISQPAATTYVHSSTLTLNYSVGDGTGSGVHNFTVTLDGSTTVAGHPLVNGLNINLLTALTLGPHTFTINAVDNLGNASSRTVVFTIIVTAQSIKNDVTQFVASGDISKNGIENSLLAKLNAAAAAEARGNCTAAENIYQAFINEVMAQTGKAISPTAASILIADAQYLISHCV